MKIINTLLVSLVLLLSINTNSLLAQETFSYDYISPTEVAVPIGGEEEFSAKVENLTTDELTLTWFIEEVDFPADWEVFVCDNGACWPPSFTTRNFTLATSEVSSLKTSILTKDVEGCGSANIRVYNNGNGEEITHTILLCTSPVGITEVVTTNVKVYPNPVSSGQDLLLELPQNVERGSIQISVFNQLGQRVHQQKQNNNQTHCTINTNQWATGIYFLEVQTGDGNVLKTQKIQIR